MSLRLAGLSNAAVRGMVAAYTGATSVSLARCAGQLRHTVDFANMFAAVSRGAGARLQGRPLLRLDLKGCIALRTDDVASLCDYFETLRYARLAMGCSESRRPLAEQLLGGSSSHSSR